MTTVFKCLQVGRVQLTWPVQFTRKPRQSADRPPRTVLVLVWPVHVRAVPAPKGGDSGKWTQ
jgi:hypothetical protein